MPTFSSESEGYADWCCAEAERLECEERSVQDQIDRATARTLELVAEWLEYEAGRASLTESAEERRQIAIALRSGEFDAWLKEREERGG